MDGGRLAGWQKSQQLQFDDTGLDEDTFGVPTADARQWAWRIWIINLIEVSSLPKKWDSDTHQRGIYSFF
jgi:hypothetical protein